MNNTNTNSDWFTSRQFKNKSEIVGEHGILTNLTKIKENIFLLVLSCILVPQE